MPKETKPETAPISIRDVEKQTWLNFRKLALLHEMSLQDYLKHLVSQEMKRVQINK